MIGKVDRIRRLAVGLSWRELAEERWGRAVLYFRRYSVSARRRCCSWTITNRSRNSRRRVRMTLSQIALALGACGGLARISMPSPMNTASKELVNWPAGP